MVERGGRKLGTAGSVKTTVEDALKMQKPAPEDALVIRPPEKKAA
jgi:hypothetical protein